MSRVYAFLLIMAFALPGVVKAGVKESDYKTDFLVVTSSVTSGPDGGCFMTLQTMDGRRYFVQGQGIVSCRAFPSGMHYPGKMVTHIGFSTIYLLWQDEHSKWKVAHYAVLRTEL